MRRKLFHATFQVSGASAIGQGVFLILTPFITRVYDPADFGVFSLYVAITLFDVMMCLGYERAIPVPREDRDGLSLLILSLALGALLSLIALVVVALFGGRIDRLFSVKGVTPLLWILPPCLFAVAATQALTNWAIRGLNFGLIGVARISMYASAGFAQLALGWIGAGALGLVLGHLAGYAVAVAILASPAVAALKSPSLPTVREARAVAQRFRRFPIYGASSTLLNSAGLQVPVLGIAFLYSAEVAGWYGLAQRVFGVPLSVIAMALGQGLKGLLSSALRNGEFAATARSLLWIAATMQLCFAAVLLAVILMAPTLFALIFGESWRNSGVYLQYLAPLLLAQFIVSPFHVVLDVLERPELHFVREILRLTLLGASFAFATAFALEPLKTVALISGSGAFVYVVSGMLVAYAYARTGTSRAVDEGK